ncbi:arylamine N-acetyltransferase family protein [Nocardioides rubriscoriae]|uniref:arylamine N-acetyltransferase family protein n=1 Tax=Nocardioides rubriscoriae TaxID=642762 RepID=UPI0011DF704F|nr:arylamine N-acetyltransferase [Nocardioides rubriscoriae]
MTTAAYLERLGLPADLPPTLETLVEVHRAHLAQVPYTNLDIMLGRPPSTVPAEALARLVGLGRAGYCFHHNGLLETVLRDLGFTVERRHGHVWTLPEQRDQTQLNHLVLVVTGLATAANPGGRWWPDVGLGEGPFDPVPLVEGDVVDGPFRFEVSGLGIDGWSFAHDPSGSFRGLEVRDLPVDQNVVDTAHAALSTPPTGVFTRVLVTQRRDPLGCDTVRCCVATRVDAGGAHQRDLTSYDDWRAALDAIGLVVADVPDDDLRALFDRMLAAHRTWDEAGRP